MTLCDQREPQLSVAVTASKLGMTLVGGKIHFGSDFGGEFFAFGIPQGHAGEFPISPEKAAEVAASQTGARVATVPRLVMPLNTDGIPQNAKWEIQLDRPVRIRSRSRGDLESAAIAMGLVFDWKGSERAALFVPVADQPRYVVAQFAINPRIGEVRRTANHEKAEVVSLRVRSRPNVALRYEPSDPRSR